MILLAVAPPLAAQPADDTIRLRKASAELFAAGRYELAAQALRQLYEVEPNPLIRFNIARCYEELGQAEPAVAAWDDYLRVARDEARMARARSSLATLEATTYGRLRVDCAPAEALVDVAGVGRGTCGFTRTRVAPGTYVVRVAAPAYAPQELELTVVAGDLAQGAVELQPAVPEPPPVPVPTTPAPTPERPRESPTPSATPGRLTTGPLVAGGAALAAGVVGAVAWYLAAGEIDRIEDAHERYRGAGEPAAAAEARDDVEAARDEASTYRVAAYGLVGLALAGLAASGTWWWLEAGAGPDGARAGLRWSF